MKVHSRTAGRAHVEPSEIAAVLTAAANDPTIFGARDEALLAMLDAGIRDDELTRIELRDFDAAAGVVRLARDGQVAHVKLSGRAALAIERWVQLRGRLPGGLIHPLERPGAIVRKRISRGLVHDVLARRSRAAGVNWITPGDLARGHEADFVFPAAARFLNRHGHWMRTALTSRLDCLAGLISGGAHTAATFDWAGLTAEQMGDMTVPPGVGQRRLNEMRTALLGVLREGVAQEALKLERFEAIRQQVWAAARRRK